MSRRSHLPQIRFHKTNPTERSAACKSTDRWAMLFSSDLSGRVFDVAFLRAGAELHGLQTVQDQQRRLFGRESGKAVAAVVRGTGLRVRIAEEPQRFGDEQVRGGALFALRALTVERPVKVPFDVAPVPFRQADHPVRGEGRLARPAPGDQRQDVRVALQGVREVPQFRRPANQLRLRRPGGQLRDAPSGQTFNRRHCVFVAVSRQILAPHASLLIDWSNEAEAEPE